AVPNTWAPRQRPRRAGSPRRTAAPATDGAPKRRGRCGRLRGRRVCCLPPSREPLHTNHTKVTRRTLAETLCLPSCPSCEALHSIDRRCHFCSSQAPTAKSASPKVGKRHQHVLQPHHPAQI